MLSSHRESGPPFFFTVAGTVTAINYTCGFNMALMCALFVWIFGRLLEYRKGAIAAAIGLGLYTVLVGADPAVVCAALMVLLNPNVPWDAGFQFSFAATLGLVLYAQPM